MPVNPLKTRQQGFTLIEILVALLVLSVGLVGLSALTLRTLQNAHSSSHFSLASAIALELEERLWFHLAHESAKELLTTGSSNLVDGCLPKTEVVEPVLASIETEWRDSGRYAPPGLSVDLSAGDWSTVIEQSVAQTGVRWMQIPVTIGWTESRFTDVTGGEAIDFTVAVPCRPIF